MAHQFLLTVLFASCAFPMLCMENNKSEKSPQNTTLALCVKAIQEGRMSIDELPYPSDGGGTQFHPITTLKIVNSGLMTGQPFEVGN